MPFAAWADARESRCAWTADGSAREWCDVDVLRQLRRRSLAALRREAGAVHYGAFRHLKKTGEPIVSFKFNTSGARKFAHATSENVGLPFAIILDREVISAPVIREPIIGEYRGYRIAAVTMDFSDWAYNDPYARCAAKGDAKAADAKAAPAAAKKAAAGAASDAKKTATARPNPICWSGERRPAANPPNTATMISAAPVMIPAVVRRPYATDPVLSPVRS